MNRFIRITIGLFISLAVSITVCTPLASLTYDIFAAKSVESDVKNFLDEKVDKNDELGGTQLLYALEDAADEWPELWRKTENMGPAESINGRLKRAGKEVNKENVAYQFSKSIVKPVMMPNLSVGCFAVVFIVAFVICMILSKSIKFVKKNPSKQTE